MPTSANFFDVLGAGASSDPDAIGSQLKLNGRLYTVLGVLPDDYHGAATASGLVASYIPARE